MLGALLNQTAFGVGRPAELRVDRALGNENVSALAVLSRKPSGQATAACSEEGQAIIFLVQAVGGGAILHMAKRAKGVL
jgi:hypothetical protein